MRKSTKEYIDKQIGERSKANYAAGGNIVHKQCPLCFRVDHRVNMVKFEAWEYLEISRGEVYASLNFPTNTDVMYIHPECLKANGFEKVRHVNGWRKKPEPVRNIYGMDAGLTLKEKKAAKKKPKGKKS